MDKSGEAEDDITIGSDSGSPRATLDVAQTSVLNSVVVLVTEMLLLFWQLLLLLLLMADERREGK